MYQQPGSRILVCLILLVMLAACSPASTPAPVTNTLPPPTNTVPPPTDTVIPPTNTPPPATNTPIPPTDTPLPPTDTPTPTPAGFVNNLIFDIPEMYSVTVQTVDFPVISDPQLPETKPATLPMYIYYPPDWQGGELLPAVILPNAWDLDKEIQWSSIGVFSSFESWGRVFASNGLIAISYDTRNPNDLEAVVKYIQEKGDGLGIDAFRLGLFARDINAWPMASFAYQQDREYIKSAVFIYTYPLLPDLPFYSYEAGICSKYGCYGGELPKVTQLRRDLPIFVVTGGQGFYNDKDMADFDYFIQQAKQQGVPMTLVEFDKGFPGFEYGSAGLIKTKGIEIIQQAIDFTKANLFNP